jgi:hypothetical protein
LFRFLELSHYGERIVEVDPLPLYSTFAISLAKTLGYHTEDRRMNLPSLRLREVVIATILFGIGGLLLLPRDAPPSASPAPPEVSLVSHLGSPSHDGVDFIPIKSIRVGQRVAGCNPNRKEVEVWVPDAKTWKKLELHMKKPSGASLWINLLRPDDWLDDRGARVGGTVELALHELGAVGPAEVTAICPCPEIRPGDGHAVVTGTFWHEVDEYSKVIALRLEGQVEPTEVTASHHYWSVDRGKFVPAEELCIGDQLDTLNGLTHVIAVEPRGDPDFVYNLETTQHVYRVGSLGTLVHNASEVFERFGSKAEAEQAKVGNLFPRPGHERQPKRIVDVGGIKKPQDLGKTGNYTHRMEIHAQEGTREWLKKNADPIPGHPNGYAIPADKLDEFNGLIDRIDISPL